MSFLKIPGFGIWNEPLPDVLSYGTSQALTWAKDKLIQAGTSDPEQATEQVVPETPPEVQTGDQNLVIQLATPHSVVLEQTLANVEIPDTSKDEELARELAKQEELPPPPYEPPKQTQTKKLEKKPDQVETSSKKSKHHHHHYHKHHSSRSHKNK
ncbi:MAG: hypothetical protein LLF94_02165 [Chlamydiales bacterium]|nr:hypothetical protein [Chlamydiales bacterium]